MVDKEPMNDSDRDWYEAQFELFSTQGYKDLIAQATEIKESLNTLAGVDTLEKLHNHRGQLEVLQWLLGWQSAVEATHKELSNENAA